jgi:hypothetical protein
MNVIMSSISLDDTFSFFLGWSLVFMFFFVLQIVMYRSQLLSDKRFGATAQKERAPGVGNPAGTSAGGEGTQPKGAPIGEPVYKVEVAQQGFDVKRKGKEELVGSIVCDLYPMNQGLRPTQGFRIQRFDAQGNPLEIVEIEVGARKIKGRFFVADTVAVKGKWKKGRFEAKSIRNLSTNTNIT